MGILSKKKQQTRRQAGKSLEKKLPIINANLKGGKLHRVTLTPEETRELIRRGAKKFKSEENFNKAKKESEFPKYANPKVVSDFSKFTSRINARIEKPTFRGNTELLEELSKKADEESQLILRQYEEGLKRGEVSRSLFEAVKKGLANERREYNDEIKSRMEALKKGRINVSPKELEEERKALINRIEQTDQTIKLQKEELKDAE